MNPQRAPQRTTLAARALALTVTASVGGALTWSYATGGIVAVLLHTAGTAEGKVAALRAFFDCFGLAAPLVYVGFVTLEVVVAPLPGTMLYAPGGIIFGGLLVLQRQVSIGEFGGMGETVVGRRTAF